MQWSKDKPTVTGWYWFKGDPYSRGRLTVIQVRIGHGKRTALYGYHGLEYGMPMESFKGKWAGPIPEPEEPTP